METCAEGGVMDFSAAKDAKVQAQHVSDVGGRACRLLGKWRGYGMCWDLRWCMGVDGCLVGVGWVIYEEDSSLICIKNVV